MKPAALLGVFASVLLLAFAFLLPPSLAQLSEAREVGFSDAEMRRIAALGPWPPVSRRDPSNRVSGKPDAIAFGEALFGDVRLSRSARFSCATCHQASRGFTDGKPRAEAEAVGDRNTLALLNLRFQRWFGWSGANDNLWAQSLRALLDEKEMAGSMASVAATLRQEADLRQRYTHVFGAAPGDNDERVAIDLSKALAAYQETLVSPRTSFDAFRDALLRKDAPTMAAYPDTAKRGLAIFVGKGNCIFCHSGPQFSNGEFHDIGVPFFAGPGRVDSGRFGGIQALQKSPYTLLGAYNDDPSRSTATSTRHVELTHRNFGEFKVPSLRNVAKTAPYMHNGSLATLRDAIGHYSELNEERLHTDGERILVPLNLTAREKDDLAAFLESLSSPD